MSFTYNSNDILKDTVLIGNPTTTTQSTTDNSTRIATTAFVKKQSFGRPLASIGTGETITTTQNGYFLHINYLNGLYVNIFNANALDNPKANFMLFNNVTSQSIPYSIELRSGVGGIFLGLLGSGISSLTIAYREVVGIQSDGSNWIITSRTSRSDIFNGTNTYTKSNVFTTNTKDYSTIMNDYNSEQHYSFLPYIQTSSFNGITQDGDMGIIFQDNAINTTKGFIISPWAANYSGIRITKDGTHIRGGLIMSPSTDSTSNVNNISFKNGGEVSTIGRLWSYYNGTTIDNKLYLDIYESLNIRNISNVADPIMNIATTEVSISKPLKIIDSISRPGNAAEGSLTLTHNVSGGSSSIVFKSFINAGSDYGFIRYDDNKGIGENASLVIGTSNDTDDDVFIQPSGRMIFDVLGNNRIYFRSTNTQNTSVTDGTNVSIMSFGKEKIVINTETHFASDIALKFYNDTDIVGQFRSYAAIQSLYFYIKSSLCFQNNNGEVLFQIDNDKNVYVNTPGTSDNSTKIATTKFVKDQDYLKNEFYTTFNIKTLGMGWDPTNGWYLYIFTIHVIDNTKQYFKVNVSTVSDENLKENIKETIIKNACSYINQIEFKSFKYKKNYIPINSTQKLIEIGVIAQQIEKIYPDFVSNVGEIKTINTEILLTFNLKATQELIKENENLKNEISLLKNEINQIKSYLKI